MAGEYKFPTDTWIYACVVPPYNGSPYPSGCDYFQIKGETLNPTDTSMTKEQYDSVFGAVLGVVAIIIAIYLIKRAIEQ